MKEYSTYIFDVDGTLIDTAELIYQCFKYSCKKFADISVDRDIVMRHIGLPFRAQLEAYIGTVDTDERVEEIFTAHMKYQKAHYPNFLSLFNGIKELLTELQKEGKKLGIVTSRKKDTLDLYLSETGILDYFTVIITPEDTEEHKPSPVPVKEALKRLESDPSESVYIGDSVFDIESGNRAGCDTVFVEWSAVHHSECHIVPTYTIKKPSELISDI